MSIRARGLRPEAVARRIASFRARFGEEHLLFAWHAAFPLTLTPDLLYHLWASFQTDVAERLLRVPWVAVADLLLSGLCDEVGHDVEDMHLFEMDLGVRAALLGALETDPRFGPPRLRELSAFLLEYIHHQAYARAAEPSDLATSQRWTALAYVQPGEAAREIAEALAGISAHDRPAFARVASIAHALEPALQGFKPLFAYVRGMSAFARNDFAQAAAELGDLVKRPDLRVAGVALPVPQTLSNRGAKAEEARGPGHPVADSDEELLPGRERELAGIQDAFAHARAVHLVGEAGVGKTALLAWIVRHAPPGFRVVQLQAASIFNSYDLLLAMARPIVGAPSDASAEREASPFELRNVIERLPPTLFIADGLDLLGGGQAASFSRELLDMLHGFLEVRRIMWASAARHDLNEVLDGAADVADLLRAYVQTIHVGRLDQGATRAPERSAAPSVVAPLSDDARSAVLPEQAPPFTFLDEAAIRDRIVTGGHGSADQIIETLKIFSTSKQHTWLVLAPPLVVCVLDDVDTRRKGVLVQFVARPAELLPVSAALKPGSRSTGVLQLKKKRWLYSVDLFPDPQELVARVNDLIQRAASETAPVRPRSLQPTAARAAETPSESEVDVLIVTALPVEFQAVLQVDAGATPGGPWLPGHRAALFDVAVRSFETRTRRPLHIAAVKVPAMGSAASASAIATLVTTLRPRCLAVCGICAGRRGAVNLGDVIIADRLWEVDGGKPIVDGVERGYAIKPAWRRQAERFRFATIGEWVRQRPRSYEDQTHWLLARLRAGEDPTLDPDAATRCADFERLLPTLRKRGWLAPVALRLSDAGRAYIDDKLLGHPVSLLEPEDFAIHVGPIASGSTEVTRDSRVFEELSDKMRKIVGVEMEGAAVAAVAHQQAIDLIVVKGVADYDDAEKNDNFQRFAARASAECAIAFVRANVEPAQSSTRRDAGDPTPA